MSSHKANPAAFTDYFCELSYVRPSVTAAALH